MTTKALPLFDPFSSLRGDAPTARDDEGTVYPGEMLKQQMRDAAAVIESAHGKPDLQPVIDAALGVMNGWATALETPSPPESDEEGSALRRTIMGSFLAGYHAAILADMTARTATGKEEIAAYAKRLAANAATSARVEKAQTRKDAIRKSWAGGEHVSRERCAHVEWERLGFPSFRTAREALNNTPDPIR